jgi:hypothetical protein
MSLFLIGRSFIVAISENVSLALKCIVWNWGPVCYGFQFLSSLESMMNRSVFWEGNGERNMAEVYRTTRARVP